MSKYLLIALSLLLVSGCSTTRVSTPIPLPPANLSQQCAALPKVPEPLIDPARIQWEADVVYAYGLCAARHRATIDAWRGAVQAAEK